MTNESMYCDVCKTALNRWTKGTDVGYVHTLPVGEAADHEPKPVPLSQMKDAIMRCDFCSSLHPTWAYNAANQVREISVVVSRTYAARDYRELHEGARVRSAKTEQGMTQSLGEKWAACEACAEYIEARNVYGLVSRVTDSMPKKWLRGKKLIEKRGEMIVHYEMLFSSLQPGRERL